ncbi:MAG: ABC transporter permease [Marinifilaceae bacterium]
MFRNLLKIIVRNLYRQKVFSVINILGLAIGIACAILIYLWVQNELSFDKFHQDSERLFTLYEDQFYEAGEQFTMYSTPAPLAGALKQTFTEVEGVSRYVSSWKKLTIKADEQSYVEERVWMADPDFLRMFNFPVVLGNMKTPLDDANSIVLTRRIASKYFGKENPIGREVEINSQFRFLVTAVIDDLPENSSFQFDLLVPVDFMARLWAFDLENWTAHSFQTLVKLREGVAATEFEGKIRNFIQQYLPETQIKLGLQPISRMHLHSIQSDWAGPVLYVRMFSFLAFLILVIACFNFMNLNTARSEKRAREVGIRKVVGAQRIQLVLQFLAESVGITLLAFGVGIALVEIFLPVFNQLTSRELVLSIGNTGFLLGMVGIVIVTGIFSGIYPAIFLSSYKPVMVLRGIPPQESTLFRKFLVVSQFAMSVGLIICTVIVHQQLHFIKGKDIGFNRNNVIYCEIVNNFNQRYPELKEELLKVPGVHWVTAANQMPIDIASSTKDVKWMGKNPDSNVLFQLCYADFDFVETFEMKVLYGRSFSRVFGDDSLKFIINRKATKLLGEENPVGMKLSVWGDEGEIIGVVKDFNYNSLQNEIEPLIMMRAPEAYQLVAIRIRGEKSPLLLKKIRRCWEKVIPDQPFDYRYLEEDFSFLYRLENRMARIFKYFSILAVVISCLGLLGLAAFVAERRTKEMGLRKVVGASVENVFVLLISQFMKWILYANLIAWPISYWLMERWLQGFAFRISIGWSVFIVSGLISMGIALLTVIYQALRVANTNPVASIKCE